jgi:hypothetical protein
MFEGPRREKMVKHTGSSYRLKAKCALWVGERGGSVDGLGMVPVLVPALAQESESRLELHGPPIPGLLPVPVLSWIEILFWIGVIILMIWITKNALER